MSSRSGFEDAIWTPFVEAWQTRGFRRLPTDSQRNALRDVADTRPNDLGRWVDEAADGSAPFEVVNHVLDRWHAARRTALAAASEADRRQAARARRLSGTTRGPEPLL
jgi:hypothetical protein